MRPTRLASSRAATALHLWLSHDALGDQANAGLPAGRIQQRVHSLLQGAQVHQDLHGASRASDRAHRRGHCGDGSGSAHLLRRQRRADNKQGNLPLHHFKAGNQRKCVICGRRAALTCCRLVEHGRPPVVLRDLAHANLLRNVRENHERPHGYRGIEQQVAGARRKRPRPSRHRPRVFGSDLPDLTETNCIRTCSLAQAGALSVLEWRLERRLERVFLSPRLARWRWLAGRLLGWSRCCVS
jgi:hypothetical protein